MKTICILILLASLALAQADQIIPTRIVGNSTVPNQLTVSAKPGKLYAVTGQNLSGSTLYIQVFQTATNAVTGATNPVAGQIPTFSVPVPASPQFYSFDFSYYGADFSPGCTICASSTASTLTLAAGSSATIQAIILGN